MPEIDRPPGRVQVNPLAPANTTPQRPRIAYLCDHNPLDPGAYSGGNTQMHAALCAHVGDVEILSPDWGLAEPLRRLMHRMPDALNLRLRWRIHLLLGRITARAVERQLAAGAYDVLFTAYSFQSLHRVRPPKGTVSIFSSDATPTIYRNSAIGNAFGSFFGPSRLLDGVIQRAERRTFRAADLLLWPSRWLRDAATGRYALDPARSVQLPWGANIETPPRDPHPPRLEQGAPLRLLFVGRDWFAKGGPLVVQIVDNLRSSGIDARLTIVGSQPPDVPAWDHITIHAALDKNQPDQLGVLMDAFRQAHFLVLPSLESYGFAFCEASAFGLPSLCFDAGGVPVRNDRNGQALDLSTPPEGFSEVITAYLSDPERYDTLRQTTRTEFETRLNWEAWGKSVARYVADLGAAQHKR